MLDETGIGAEYAEVIEAMSPLRYSVKVGEVRPLYATTTGMFRPLSDDRLAEYLDGEAFSSRRDIDQVRSARRPEVIRRTGFASNIDGMVKAASFGRVSPRMRASSSLRW